MGGVPPTCLCYPLKIHLDVGPLQSTRIVKARTLTTALSALHAGYTAAAHHASVQSALLRLPWTSRRDVYETEVSSRRTCMTDVCGRLDQDRKSSIHDLRVLQRREPNRSITPDEAVYYWAAGQGAVLTGEGASRVQDCCYRRDSFAHGWRLLVT